MIIGIVLYNNPYYFNLFYYLKYWLIHFFYYLIINLWYYFNSHFLCDCFTISSLYYPTTIFTYIMIYCCCTIAFSHHHKLLNCIFIISPPLITLLYQASILSSDTTCTCLFCYPHSYFYCFRHIGFIISILFSVNLPTLSLKYLSTQVLYLFPSLLTVLKVLCLPSLYFVENKYNHHFA